VGGEAFVVLAPETDLSGMTDLAEKLKGFRGNAQPKSRKAPEKRFWW